MNGWGVLRINYEGRVKVEFSSDSGFWKASQPFEMHGAKCVLKSYFKMPNFYIVILLLVDTLTINALLEYQM